MEPKIKHHLSLDDRIKIEQYLNEGRSLRFIAKELDKSVSTISREIKKRRSLMGRRTTKSLPKCANYSECNIHGLCTDIRCYKYQCRSCITCKSVCPEYVPSVCKKTEESPYVCNSCKDLNVCTYERLIYVAKYADDMYRDISMNIQ